MGVKLSAKVTGNGYLTLAGLEAVRDELRGAGVPSHAELCVRELGGISHEVEARWEPRPVDADTLDYCGRCSMPIRTYGASPSGWVHVDEGDPDTNYNHVAGKGRPIRDNPQA